MKSILTSVFAGALVLGLVVSGSASAATIIFGNTISSTSNIYPFATAYVGKYQQVYDGSLFSGPVSISQIGFFAGVGTPSPALFTGNYTLSLSTSSVTVNSLSKIYANNIGANNTLFFNGAVSNVISFTGTPFLFDPLQGNLLLDLFVNTPNSNPLAHFAAGCTTQTNRVFNFSGNSSSHGIGASPGQCTPNSYGLETQFTFTAAAVPEPSALALFGVGLLGLVGFGAARRRKPASV